MSTNFTAWIKTPRKEKGLEHTPLEGRDTHGNIQSTDVLNINTDRKYKHNVV